MKVLVACEFSGRVREAFRALGHDAWSCDLLPSEIEGQHIQGNVLGILDRGWDIMIAHPPCTYLAVSGARWWKDRREEQQAAVDFVFKLLEAPIERIAIENPVGCLPKFIGEWDQMIEPRQFGEKVSKATCLWLKGLPTLRATNKVSVLEVQDTIHREPPGPERWKNRSRTFLGVAAAMAQQWGVA